MEVNLVTSLYFQPVNDTVTLTQTVKPHRDFLSGSFLVPLNNTQMGPLGAPISVGGQWQVTLETFVIDEQGCVWSSGTKKWVFFEIVKQRLYIFIPARF